MTIDIGICTDENYAMACGVCITSIFENNKNNLITIHILTDGLSKDSLNKFRILAKLYNQNVNIINIDSTQFNGLPIIGRFKRSIYFRFLFPSILSEDITRLLYIDCDIIILKDLSHLINTNLNDYPCGVIEDQFSDDITIRNRIDQYDDYFNSGVMLLDLSKWRKQSLSKKCIQFMHDYPEKCFYPDQDTLNIILHNNICWLDSIYNYQQGYFNKNENLLIHKNKWPKINRKLEDIVIMHYTDSIKPWHKECFHPYKSLFIYYKNNSLWKLHPIYFYNNNFISRCQYYLKTIQRYISIIK